MRAGQSGMRAERKQRKMHAQIKAEAAAIAGADYAEYVGVGSDKPYNLYIIYLYCKTSTAPSTNGSATPTTAARSLAPA
jgi:hypothetical protein